MVVIRQGDFADELRRNVQLVTLPPIWKERFLAKIEQWESEESTEKQAQLTRLRAELAVLKTKIERLNEAFTDGSIDLAEFKELKNPLVPKKVEAEAKIGFIANTRMNPVEPVRNWVLEASKGEKLISEGNLGEMKSFLQNVGLNRVFQAKTLTVSFIKPWQSLAETSLATRAHNELSSTNTKWWRWRELNPRAPDLCAPHLRV